MAADQNSSVTVEFYGVPRLYSGCATLAVPGGTIAEVLERVRHACPSFPPLLGRDGQLVPHYLLSLNGNDFVSDIAAPLQPGDRLLLMSADAGG